MRTYSIQPRSTEVLAAVAPAAASRRPRALSLRSGHPISAACSLYRARILADECHPASPAIRARMGATSASSGGLWEPAGRATSGAFARVTTRSARHEGHVIVVMSMTLKKVSEPVKRHAATRPALSNASPGVVTRPKSLTLAYRQRCGRCVTHVTNPQKVTRPRFVVVARGRMQARKGINWSTRHTRHGFST